MKKSLSSVNTFSFFVSLLIYALAFFYVTDNADWANYEFYYYNPDSASDLDLFFRRASSFFLSNGWPYIYLYRFYIILAGLLFSLFSSKFTSKSWIVIFVFVLVFYIPLCNQIRYFLAASSILVAFQYLIEKRYVKHLLFILLGFFSHQAIIVNILVFYLFYFFWEYIRSRLFSFILLCNIAIFLLENVLSAFFSDRFLVYFNVDNQSTLLGGLFRLVLPMYLVVTTIRALKKNNLLDAIKKCPYAPIAFGALVFLLPSVYILIFDRFYYFTLILWPLLMLQQIDVERGNIVVSNSLRNTLRLQVFFVVAWTFLCSHVITGGTSYFEQILEILKTTQI